MCDKLSHGILSHDDIILLIVNIHMYVLIWISCINYYIDGHSNIRVLIYLHNAYILETDKKQYYLNT